MSKMLSSPTSTLLELPLISRVRRNHALEHATGAQRHARAATGARLLIDEYVCHLTSDLHPAPPPIPHPNVILLASNAIGP